MKLFGLSKKIYNYKEMMVIAVEELIGYTGKQIKAIVPIELGGTNTAAAIAAASHLNLTIVDGDFAGRAIPEIPQTTPFLNGKTLWPISSVDEYGNICVIKNVTNVLIAERIGKYISAASFGVAAQCGFLMKGKELKKAVIPGAISYALKIGRAYRKAKEENNDLALEIAKAGSGYILFRGRVKDFQWEDKDGFTVGNTYIEGEDDYVGSEYKIWFKNENIIAWRDQNIDVTVPDLICMICDDKKEPLTNPNYEVDMKVSIIGLPAPKEWRTDEGLKIFGPRHFGYDIEYIPIEKCFKELDK